MKSLLLVLVSIGVLSAGDMVFHEKTGLFWQDNRLVMSEKITYKEAEELCEGLKVGGYSDWRIPTIRELLTIIDYKKYDPAILDGFSIGESSYFWSSSQYMGDPDKVWGVNFKDGSLDSNGKSYDRRVRCVRITTK